MKKIKRVTVVEGNPSEVRNEILLKKNNATGKIDLLKRDSSGTLKSIVLNTDLLAHPEKGLTPMMGPTGKQSEFMSAFQHLFMTMLTSSTLKLPYVSIMKAEVELTEQVQHDIDTIAAYLPSMNNDDYMFKSPNIVNVSGVVRINEENPSKNVIRVGTQDRMLTISFSSENKVKLTLFDATV